MGPSLIQICQGFVAALVKVKTTSRVNTGSFPFKVFPAETYTGAQFMVPALVQICHGFVAALVKVKKPGVVYWSSELGFPGLNPAEVYALFFRM